MAILRTPVCLALQRIGGLVGGWRASRQRPDCGSDERHDGDDHDDDIATDTLLIAVDICDGYGQQDDAAIHEMKRFVGAGACQIDQSADDRLHYPDDASRDEEAAERHRHPGDAWGRSITVGHTASKHEQNDTEDERYPAGEKDQWDEKRMNAEQCG